MQKSYAVNDFVIDNWSGFTGVARSDSTIKSILEGAIGLPGAGAQLAQRYGRWPLVSGLQRPGLRLNLTTYYLTCTNALRYAQRNSLLAELNPELEETSKLYAADYVTLADNILAFGPWDTRVDDDGEWTIEDLLERATGTHNGGLIFGDGNNSRARAIIVAEATTNYINNPSFEVNVTDDWTLSAGGSINHDTDVYLFGQASGRLTAGATDQCRIQSGNTSVANGESITTTAWFKGEAGTSARLTIRDTTGGTDLGSDTQNADADGGWLRLEVTWTNSTGGALNTAARLYNRTADSVSEVWFDGVQVEKLLYPTEYCDGDRGPGHAWSGTAHNSDSTRTASEIVLNASADLVNEKDELTVLAWVQAPYDWDEGPADNWVIFSASQGSAFITLRYDQINSVFEWALDDGVDGVTVQSAVQAFSAGDWLCVAGTAVLNDSGAGDYRLYVDNVVTTSTTSNVGPPPASQMNIGTNTAEDDHWNGRIEHVAVFERALNATELSQLYTLGGHLLRSRYLDVLCEASQPLVIDGVPTGRGNVSTLAVDDDVRWRSMDGDVAFWYAYDDTWNQTLDIDSDDYVRPIIRLTPDVAKDAGTGFLYKRPVLVEWKAPSSAESYPITFSLDTSTLSGAGKVQGDLDDLRVYVGGLEVDRWLDSTTPAVSTKIWFNLDFSAHLEYDLKTAIAGAGAITEIEIDEDEDISTLPASGLVLIDSEVFVYTGKNNVDRTLTGVVRAMRGTSAAAHTVGDTVKWIQHDVYVVYGDSSLSAPVTNDDFKPILNLSTSTNDSWVYANFGEDNKPRAAGWHSEVVQDPLPFDDSFSDFEILTGGASPWTDIEIDNLLYLGDAPGGTSGPAATGKVGEARWKVNNVCGITNAVFSNITGPGANYVPRVDTAMQSSEDGSTWVREASVSSGLDPVNQALNASGLDKWVALYSFNTVSYGENSGLGNSADIKVSDVTLTLYTTLTPDTTVQSEETACQISAVLTNSTTGQALKIDFIMDLDETLEIDTDNDTVTYLMDGTSQQQAIQQVGGAEREQFRLAPGENALEWDDTGTNDMALAFVWERRYWE